MSTQTALLDFLDGLGIKREAVVFKRNGKVAYINCLFHSEKTPSMRIVPGLKYYCFGCGKSGNCKDDLQKMLDSKRRQRRYQRISRRRIKKFRNTHQDDHIPFD